MHTIVVIYKKNNESAQLRGYKPWGGTEICVQWETKFRQRCRTETPILSVQVRTRRLEWLIICYFTEGWRVGGRRVGGVGVIVSCFGFVYTGKHISVKDAGYRHFYSVRRRRLE